MIPYVISEAYPDYKRPSVINSFGAIDENELDIFFIKEVADFIIDRSDINTFKETSRGINGVKEFFEEYYSDCYMGNSPWEAKVFYNGEWKDMTPSYGEIYEYIKYNYILQTERISDYYEDETPIKHFDWDFNENELKTIENMSEIFMSILKDEPPETLAELFALNNVEQLIFIIYKLTNSENEIIQRNKQLIMDYIQLHLHHIDKDIQDTTNSLEKSHNERDSEKLKNLINLYSNVVYYKNMLD